MKRRTLTTIEFARDPRGIELPCKEGDQIADLRMLSNGHEHSAILFICTDGNYECDRESTDSVFEKLVSVSRQAQFSVTRSHQTFRINFGLVHGKSFCETALEIGLLILKALDVKEESARDYLLGLKIEQETQVKYHKQWMSYTQYLLLTNPILAPKA